MSFKFLKFLKMANDEAFGLWEQEESIHLQLWWGRFCRVNKSGRVKTLKMERLCWKTTLTEAPRNFQDKPSVKEREKPGPGLR